MELRSCFSTELRMDFEAKWPVIRGYAAMFNSLSNELSPGVFELVSPGAFKRSIEQDDIRALFNHNPDHVLGRKGNGTLKLKEDEKGLLVEILPPDTQWAGDLITSIKRGDVSQMSFGFTIDEGGKKWSIDPETRKSVRTLTSVKLFDVSPVTFPAYNSTQVSVRMVRSDAGIYSLVEDSDKGPVVLVSEEPIQQAPVQGDVSVTVFDQFEALKARLETETVDTAVTDPIRPPVTQFDWSELDRLQRKIKRITN